MSAIVPTTVKAPARPFADAGGALASVPPLDVTYVDEARTHHVHARLAKDPDTGRLLFLVMESSYEGFSNDDLLFTRVPLHDAWEARYHQADLEGRLAQIGKYWRHDRATSAGWLALRRNAGVPRVDLRPVPWDERERGLGFHHFHRPGEQERLLVTLPRPLPVGMRFTVADLTFDFPNARTGELKLLHDHLPMAPLRSLLTREHVELARQGYDKLVDPREFSMKYGPDWRKMMHDAFAVVVERIADNQLGKGHAPEACVPDAGFAADFQRLLADPRLATIHRKFLAAADEEILLATNPVMVRRWVASKRARTRHEEQHLLSLVEASLLARLAIHHGSALDDQIARQLRRLAFYL